MQILLEGVVRGSFSKFFINISQMSQENTCLGVSFYMSLLRKKLQRRYFPMKFVNFLRALFLRVSLVAASNLALIILRSECALSVIQYFDNYSLFKCESKI